MAGVPEKSICGGEYKTLAEAFAGNSTAKSNGQVCHVESETQFSWSSPHVKSVYVLEEGEGDICPTKFYIESFDVKVKDGKACAQEMERKLGGIFRLGPLVSECPYHHKMTGAPSLVCGETLEVQKVSPEEAVVLDVKEIVNSFETSVQQFFDVFSTPYNDHWSGDF